jgi:hypothetical protein
MRGEDGVTLVLVVFTMALLSLIAVLLLDIAKSELTRSDAGLKRDASFAAAEAGVEDYISKLVENRLFYVHQVHAGEATRREPGGTLVVDTTDDGVVVPWTYGLTWTYPNSFDNWRNLSNGYQYSLQITPPTAGSKVVKIVAAGRKQGSTENGRVVEVLVRPSSLADFQRVVNGDVNWGATAITNGKLYANGDISHAGTARADIYAEGSVTGSPTLQNGAQSYDSTNIRTVIKNPVNFAALLASLVDIQRAATVGGVTLDNPATAAWRVTFLANGTFNAQACSLTGGSPPETTAPTCAAATNYPVPTNGAVYAGQTVVVSGTVNGRVSIGSNDDIVIANNIDYVLGGDDVLGLVTKNDVLGAAYVPANLTWRASVIAQSGTWRGAGPAGSKTLMTWYGSSTTNLGGDWTQFTARDYSYDENLLFLPPPWFPVIDDAYTIQLFRELSAP